MFRSIEKLLTLGSDQLMNERISLPINTYFPTGIFEEEFSYIFNSKNGFFAFESALHFFPISSSSQSIGVLEWNSDALWRGRYNGIADNLFFFAEDIFGCQFCLKNNIICSFDPETGALDEIASSLDEWAEKILTDFEVLTGFTIAHEWQMKNGRLPHDKRLMPKIPFVCGGEFSIDNLIEINAISGMRTRANLACQIIDIEDGTEIEFVIVD